MYIILAYSCCTHRIYITRYLYQCLHLEMVGRRGVVNSTSSFVTLVIQQLKHERRNVIKLSKSKNASFCT